MLFKLHIQTSQLLFTCQINLQEVLYQTLDYYTGIRSVVIDNELKTLTQNEARLFEVLLKHRNKILPPPVLSEETFGPGYADYMIKVYINFLRKKVETDPKKPELIMSTIGGYYLLDRSRLDSNDKEGLSLKETEDLPQIYHHPAFEYHMERNLIVVNGEEIHLTPIEKKLLTIFTYNPNQFLPRGLLINRLWPDDLTDKGLKSHIRHLREKIEPGCRQHEYQYIVVEQWFGYKLVDPSKLKA